MFHYAIFGSTEGEIPANHRFSAVTLFGHCRLKRPTLAQRLQNVRSKGTARKRSWFDRLAGSDRGLIMTIFGATEVEAPTLMEEYSAMRSMFAAGTLRIDECQSLAERLGADEEWAALTVFGVCTTTQAKRARQAKALDAGVKAGLISREHRLQLDELITAPTGTAAAVLARLAAQPA